jgi:hypothetical protein
LAAILLIFQVQMLIQVLRDECNPLLRSVNDTASTVRGTTEFVSHNMVSPFIRWRELRRRAARQRICSQSSRTLAHIHVQSKQEAKRMSNQRMNSGSFCGFVFGG